MVRFVRVLGYITAISLNFDGHIHSGLQITALRPKIKNIKKEIEEKKKKKLVLVVLSQFLASSTIKYQ